MFRILLGRVISSFRTQFTLDISVCYSCESTNCIRLQPATLAFRLVRLLKVRLVSYCCLEITRPDSWAINFDLFFDKRDNDKKMEQRWKMWFTHTLYSLEPILSNVDQENYTKMCLIFQWARCCGSCSTASVVKIKRSFNFSNHSFWLLIRESFMRSHGLN